LPIHHPTSKSVAGRLRVFTEELLVLKPVLSRNFRSPVENRPKICIFGENWVKI